MLLTITTTHQPARDLGYLLYKNPDNIQSFNMPYGQAHVYYPEADDKRCTMALLMEVDPVGIIRGKKKKFDDTFGLSHYINDRPYVSSSLLSVTISRVLGTALAGWCSGKPELATQAIPLEATLAVVPCRGGKEFLRKLFQPLGYYITAKQHPLDEAFPQWGPGLYFTVTLRHTITVKELLNHIYVLVPVLDGQKHYWVGEEEVEKLLQKGAGWLESHPARDIIAYRYLKRKHALSKDAIKRLLEEENPDDEEFATKEDETVMEKKIQLDQLRVNEVVRVFKEENVSRVLDLGCGEGKLLKYLLSNRSFTEIVGMDISHRSLQHAASRLHLDRLPDRHRERIKLIHGSLTYRDKRLNGYDAAAVVEVIEHLEPDRLEAFEQVLFKYAAPKVVVITTPNIQYNVNFKNLPQGKLRHSDHRFEWTRDQFQLWAEDVAKRYGYSVRFQPVGPEIAETGAPTQMGVFKK